MSANKKYLLAAAALLAFLAATSFLKSFLRHNDAEKVVTSVLGHWQDGNLPTAMSYWEVPENAPPVYDLTAFTLEGGGVFKKDGAYRARFTATLDFPPGNPFPSGEKWVFALAKTRYGWKITDFRLSADAAPRKD